MRWLLILTIFFSLTQLASAERWRGLIASVAALESAKVEVQEPVSEPAIETPKAEIEPVTKAPVADPEPVVTYEKVCDSSGCRLVPTPSAGVATETTEDGKKSVSPPASTTKYYTTRRVRFFGRRCSSCR